MSSSHLKALLNKNWILWKRSWVCSLLEILIPVTFTVLFPVLRLASPLTNVPYTTYYNDPYYAEATKYSNHRNMKGCNQDQNGGYVALAPISDPLIQILNQTLSDTSYKTMGFNNDDEIDAYVKADDYASGDKNLCFGVTLSKNNVSNEYEYSIRFNMSQGYGGEDIPNTNIIQRVNPVLPRYHQSGFHQLQIWMDNYILQQEVGQSASIDAMMQSVSVPAYEKDEMLETWKGVSFVFLAIPMMLPYLRMVNNILREKEKRIKEGMKIMGLQSSAFYFSWIITYSIIFFLCSVLVTVVLCNSFLKHSHWLFIFLWHSGFCFANMSIGILITVFFNKAKIGSVIAFVIAFTFAWPYQNIKQESASASTIFGACVCPTSSLCYGAGQIFNLEVAGLGLTSDTVNMSITNFKMSFHYIMSAVVFSSLLLLAAYLEQVMPSEFGVRKHPLFCLMRRTRVQPQNEDTPQDTTLDKENFEAVDPTLLAQDKQNESIRVQNLKKLYPNGKLAVDGVTYNMYKGQIFALLGHNGAGKTSTINMITGLYEASSGTVSVFGLDIHKDLDVIRKSLGVCPQHDVLFDKLTVREHLELYAIFKGMNPKDFKDEINQILHDLDLEEKADYLSKDLSGGQKRKLSVGIAFVGGSKFILLDEPSSGLDTTARRRLWDMLKNSKSGKVILLTTHYMDEADFLGDRIAIMGGGKIQCLGSSLFLKNKFGVGYNLTIVKSSNVDPNNPIIDAVKKYVPGLTSDGTHTTAELSIKLPTEASGKFKALFDHLDANLSKLKITSYGVSVTTLEEVFLTVAKHDVKKQGVFEKLLTGKNMAEENYTLAEERITDPFEKFAGQFKALFAKRYQYAKRDKRGLFVELIIPVVMIIVGVALSVNPLGNPVTMKIVENFYDEKNLVPYNTILPNGSGVDTRLIDQISTTYFTMKPESATNISELDAAMYSLRYGNPFPKIGYYLMDVNSVNNTYKYFFVVDTRAQDASPFAINTINNAILKYATNNPSKKITNIIKPFPNTRGTKAVGSAISGFGITFSFAIGMSFIPASIITYIVRERETNFKHQQIISGMSISAYWVANFVFEYIKYLIPCVLCPVFAYLMGADGFTADDKFLVLWLLFILFGASTSTFTYLSSYLFKDPGSAQTATFFLNFGIGFIGALACGLLRLFGTTAYITKIIQWPLRAIPCFSLTYGFLNLNNRELISMSENNFVTMDAIDIDIAGGDLIGLGGTTIIYYILLFFVEYLGTLRCQCMEPKVKFEPPGAVDGDVEAEAELVESTNENFAIKVKKMRKVYRASGGKKKVAVDRVSFAIPAGECFGLLGVNGAGKTTTFKMLTGEINPSEGEILIKGYKVPTQIYKARQFIGYCPQYDTLLENLTAKEHLELYAALKGIPERYREKLIQRQLTDLNLKQFEHVMAGTYSGGNKRKLSVAIALLGSPPIIFLDEPSNGMDPEARRFMWDVISKISTDDVNRKNRSSVILTTHSMEEAEYLSSRIAIQVGGNLKCLGTAQHIKTRYGGGFELEVKIEFPTKDQVKAAVKSIPKDFTKIKTFDALQKFLATQGVPELFKEVEESKSGGPIWSDLKKGEVDASLVMEWILIEKSGLVLLEKLKSQFRDLAVIEHFQSFFRLKIASDVSIGKVFGFFEEFKSELKVVQYSVRQTSIEQIFNAFATGQIKIKERGDEALSNSIVSSHIMK